MPLAEQCMALGLEFVEIKRKNPATPLGEGLTYFQEKGYEGAYCKSGPLLMLLRAVLLDLLENLNLFKSRKDATVRRFEDLLIIHKNDLSPAEKGDFAHPNR